MVLALINGRCIGTYEEMERDWDGEDNDLLIGFEPNSNFTFFQPIYENEEEMEENSMSTLYGDLYVLWEDGWLIQFNHDQEEINRVEIQTAIGHLPRHDGQDATFVPKKPRDPAFEKWQAEQRALRAEKRNS